jgi:hypothetical protein
MGEGERWKGGRMTEILLRYSSHESIACSSRLKGKEEDRETVSIIEKLRGSFKEHGSRGESAVGNARRESKSRKQRLRVEEISEKGEKMQPKDSASRCLLYSLS